MRLNVGAGDGPLEGYINLDMAETPEVDVMARAPSLPFLDGSFEEIYAGHFLEHLTMEEAVEFIADCHRCLAPFGWLAIVVPDTRLIMKRWLEGAPDCVPNPLDPDGAWYNISDLDAVCGLFLYSTVQESRHRWSYDKNSLARRMAMAGFGQLREIDRHRDERLAAPAWYQVGIEGMRDWEKVTVCDAGGGNA